MADLQAAQERMRRLNSRIAQRAQQEVEHGDARKGRAKLAQLAQLNDLNNQIDQHLSNVAQFRELAMHSAPKAQPAAVSFLQRAQVKVHQARAPEDELAKEMTHDLEMNFNKIA